jgi:hypothetical protein
MSRRPQRQVFGDLLQFFPSLKNKAKQAVRLRMKAAKTFVAWIVVFVLISCAALVTSQDSDRRLELPFGHVMSLSSPNGRYILVGTSKRIELSRECAKCFSISSKLWFKDRLSHARKLILDVSSTASAGWSPDGGAFYVEDHIASNITEAYIYETASLNKLDIADRIFAADPKAKQFAGGHAYFNTKKWQDDENLLVEFTGHTDESPAICFHLSYLVNRSGAVKKLSEHIGTPTEPWCQF